MHAVSDDFHSRRMIMSKTALRRLGKLVFTATSILLLSCGGAAAGDKSRVLILNSYHSIYPWTAEVTEGVRQALLSGTGEVEFSIEYMDTKHSFSKAAQAAFLDYMQTKYSARELDLVVCVDDDALAFLHRIGRRLFPGVPVVFCGLNNRGLYDPDMYPNATGLFEDVDILGTAELAMRLFPGSRNLVLISDMSDSGLAVLSRARRELAGLDRYVRIIDLFALSTSELQERLSALPPGSVILMLIYFQDEDGNFISPSQSASLVRDSCPSPLFSLWDMMPAAGAFGGNVLSARRHGEKAGEIALQVLSGVPPVNVPAQPDTEYVPMFDYGELARFGIKKEDLPHGSTVINEPEQDDMLNYRLILINAAVLLSGAGYVALLMMNERRRKKAAKSLAVRKSMWEGLFGNSPDSYIVFDSDNRVLNVNAAFCRMFGYTPEEALGRDVDTLVAGGHEEEDTARRISRRVQQGEAVSTEGVRRRKDGGAVQVRLQGVSFSLPGGEVLGYGIYTDISAQRKGELEMEGLIQSEAAVVSISGTLLSGDSYSVVPKALEEAASLVGADEGFFIEFADSGYIGRELLLSGGRAVWSSSPHLSDILAWPDIEAINQRLLGGERLVLDHERPSPIGDSRRHGELARLFGSPLHILPVLSEGRVAGWVGLHRAWASQSEAQDSALDVFCDLVGSVLQHERRQSASAERARILEGTSRGIVEILGRTLAMKDPYTVGHQFEVARLARAMAVKGGFDETFLDRVYYGALVHDLGKIVIPSSILSKPGRLNQVEFEIIKRHAIHGWEILSSAEFPWPLAEIAVQHHERMNGSGYPNGLVGAEIISEARIVAVADVVEAMTSHRPYRPGLGLDRALDEVNSGSGSLFDPLAVELCLAVMEDGFQFDEKSYEISLI